VSSSYPGPARCAAAALAGGATAAAAAGGAYSLLRRYPPAGEKTWVRTNHRGEPLTLLEGPAVPLGAVAGAAVTGLVLGGAGARRSLWPMAVAGLGALGFGVLDDLRGSAKRRGLRGHLGALAHGEVTTGTVKLAGLAATGLAAALLDGALSDGGRLLSDRAAPVDVAVNSGLIAGGANLLNLFDLRPGRAAKVALLSAALIAAGGATGRDRERLAALAAVAAPAGAVLALLPEDLGERAMLGDAGANALGALLGAAAARSLPRPARIGALGAVAVLTVASERVSFTRVIAATPPLHWLDMLGRRPAADGAAATPAAPVTSGTGPEQPRRRRPGRHRRVVNGIASSRSGRWLGSRLKTGAPAEP
jgi:UDP-N-acetylmuramyl pentapeptide phosphotransferase/UDP-N-acetylglucosamine-1-phosphate transferase